jgi:hypothetical protein
MATSFLPRLLLTLFLGLTSLVVNAQAINFWFPPDWKTKAGEAQALAETLAKGSGLSVQPRIAKNYGEILDAFTKKEPAAVYVGSFVQAILRARQLGTPLVQAINGKELYSGIMVFPKGGDAAAILKTSPAEIAFAVGASSGESAAKAATGGQAAIAAPSHQAACGAVKASKAKAAFVKNWWWEANKDKFPEFEVYEVPGVSEQKNPDNILTVSKAISPADAAKLKDAALAAKDVFGATNMKSFDGSALDFSIALMKKGKLDPLTYQWKND